METKKRTKYYPINLKDKKLHHEFMGLGLDIDAKNVDQTLKYLLKSLEDLKKCKDENGSLEKKYTQKENDFEELLKTLVEKDYRIEKIGQENKQKDARIKELEQEIERLKGDEK